jgi:AraC-like DNA-binding protein/quercetin dioxygenase-like cupin family protein
MKTVFAMVTGEEDKLPFHVKGVGIQQNQEHIIRPSGLPYYQWLHCIKGAGKLIIAGNEYRISEEMGFFLCPNIPHEYFAITEPWTTHWLTFDGPALDPLLDLLNMGKWNVFHISSLQTLNRMLDEIYLSICSESPLKLVECSALLYQFLVKLRACTHTESSSNTSAPYRQLQPVINYMEQNYFLSPCLNDMASIIKVSPHHLCRLFKRTFHMTPSQYLTRLRIQKAKEHLIQVPGATINEIAQKVGYGDTSYFCAVFKKYEGVTPMEFKKIHGAT